jgi:hypothetical protein
MEFNMFKPLFLSSLFILATGCGGSGGKSTQGELAEAVVGALNTGNTKALTKLFPTKADLKSSFKCDSTDAWAELNGRFLQEKEAVLERLPEGLELISEDKEVSYNGFSQRNLETLPVGNQEEGCEVIKEFAMVEGKTKVSVTSRGETENKAYLIRMIRLKEKYFVVESTLFQSLQQSTILQMHTMNSAMGIYKVTHSMKYPKSLEDVQANFAHNKVPTDAWGGPFSYQQEDGGRAYTLTSLGEDGKPGGAGSDADIVSKSGVIAD